MREKALEVDGMRAELAAMRSTLNRELVNFRQGKFDPVKYIEETATLSKQLQTEIGKRKELEQEIEHIKKGSIAVIKYVKSQQLKGGTSPDMKKKLDQEEKAREALQGELAEMRSVNDTLKNQIESGFSKMKPDQRDVKKREAQVAEHEALLRAKEERLAKMRPEEGGAPNEELKRRLEEELREKEQDYLAKEEQFKKRIIGLEGEVSKYKIDNQVRAEAQAFEPPPLRQKDHPQAVDAEQRHGSVLDVVTTPCFFQVRYTGTVLRGRIPRCSFDGAAAASFAAQRALQLSRKHDRRGKALREQERN